MREKEKKCEIEKGWKNYQRVRDEKEREKRERDRLKRKKEGRERGKERENRGWNETETKARD